MSVSGIITLGLLVSPSEIITLGYSSGAAVSRTRVVPTWYYQPGPMPFDAPGWLKQELQRISQATYGAAPVVQYQELHAEPEKPRAGMTVLADGTDWDPGSGAGFYGYYGGSWVKLG